MKKEKFLTLLLLAVVTMGFVTSCGDDDDEGGGGGLTGTYVMWNGMAADNVKDYRAIRIINGNTMEYYSHVADAYISGEYTKSFKGKSGWYYRDNSGYQTYTFVVEGNKLYATGGAFIYTISGNMLIPDGFSAEYGYSKVK